MAKFEVHLNHRLRGDLDGIIDRVFESKIPCHWLFVYGNENSTEVHERDPANAQGILAQMGLTIGARGKVYLVAPTDEDAVALRMKVGL